MKSPCTISERYNDPLLQLLVQQACVPAAGRPGQCRSTQHSCAEPGRMLNSTGPEQRDFNRPENERAGRRETTGHAHIRPP